MVNVKKSLFFDIQTTKKWYVLMYALWKKFSRFEISGRPHSTEPMAMATTYWYS